MFQTKLRELREAAGYSSQQSFADAFGVAQSTVGGWEAGKREPNYATTIRLARFFGVTIDTLLLDDPLPPSFMKQKNAPAMSAEAIKIGKAYDLADEKSRDIVRVTLKEYITSEKANKEKAVS